MKNRISLYEIGYADWIAYPADFTYAFPKAPRAERVVLEYILARANHDGQGGILSLMLPQSEMATELGYSRVTINRALGGLARKGVIETTCRPLIRAGPWLRAAIRRKLARDRKLQWFFDSEKQRNKFEREMRRLGHEEVQA